MRGRTRTDKLLLLFLLWVVTMVVGVVLNCSFVLHETLFCLAPLLEDAHSLTLTVGAPQVAPTSATRATVIRPMITPTSSSDTRPSVKINHRRTSKQIIRTRSMSKGCLTPIHKRLTNYYTHTQVPILRDLREPPIRPMI